MCLSIFYENLFVYWIFVLNQKLHQVFSLSVVQQSQWVINKARGPNKTISVLVSLYFRKLFDIRCFISSRQSNGSLMENSFLGKVCVISVTMTANVMLFNERIQTEKAQGEQDWTQNWSMSDTTSERDWRTNGSWSTISMVNSKK